MCGAFHCIVDEAHVGPTSANTPGSIYLDTVDSFDLSDRHVHLLPRAATTFTSSSTATNTNTNTATSTSNVAATDMNGNGNAATSPAQQAVAAASIADVALDPSPLTFLACTVGTFDSHTLAMPVATSTHKQCWPFTFVTYIAIPAQYSGTNCRKGNFT